MSKNGKIIIAILSAILVGLVIYFVAKHSKDTAPSGNISQTQAVEMSKLIADLYETEVPSEIAKADVMAQQLLDGGWKYLGYGQVSKA